MRGQGEKGIRTQEHLIGEEFEGDEGITQYYRNAEIRLGNANQCIWDRRLEYVHN